MPAMTSPEHSGQYISSVSAWQFIAISRLYEDVMGHHLQPISA
jgi:hypothetical protein